MNSCLFGLVAYFEQVLHPAGGRDERVKAKRRSAKAAAYPLQASPESIHLRTSARSNNSIRRNPAP